MSHSGCRTPLKAEKHHFPTLFVLEPLQIPLLVWNNRTAACLLWLNCTHRATSNQKSPLSSFCHLKNTSLDAHLSESNSVILLNWRVLAFAVSDLISVICVQHAGFCAFEASSLSLSWWELWSSLLWPYLPFLTFGLMCFTQLLVTPPQCSLAPGFYYIWQSSTGKSATKIL